jgi:hypothetical protein
MSYKPLELTVDSPDEFQEMINNKDFKICKSIVEGVLANIETKKQHIHVLSVVNLEDNLDKIENSNDQDEVDRRRVDLENEMVDKNLDKDIERYSNLENIKIVRINNIDDKKNSTLPKYLVNIMLNKNGNKNK